MKLFIMICVISMVSACSTVAGIGKDIQSTAEWTKEKMN
jgi:predicted small secreted protein